MAELHARAASAQATGILFGRERWGLTNEEVALADVILTYPVNPKFASLNMAQAVLLIAYEWMAAGLDGALPTRDALPDLDHTPAPKAHLIGLMTHLERALDPTGYFRTEDMKPTMVQNLRAILQRAGLTKDEIDVLHGVIGAFERLPGTREGRGIGWLTRGRCSSSIPASEGFRSSAPSASICPPCAASMSRTMRPSPMAAGRRRHSAPISSP